MPRMWNRQGRILNMSLFRVAAQVSLHLHGHVVRCMGGTALNEHAL